MKKILTIIIFGFILFSCDTEYIETKREDIKVGELESVMKSDTSMVYMKYDEGESIIYNIKNKTYYKSYSRNYTSKGIINGIFIGFIVGILFMLIITANTK